MSMNSIRLIRVKSIHIDLLLISSLFNYKIAICLRWIITSLTSTVDSVIKFHLEIYLRRNSALNGVYTYFDLSVKTAKNF
jgi:hypothetical protein